MNKKQIDKIIARESAKMTVIRLDPKFQDIEIKQAKQEVIDELRVPKNS